MKLSFKSSPLGKIPEEWEVMEVQQFSQVVGGGTPSTKNSEYFGGDLPWLTPKDLSNYCFRYISRGERNITKKGLENSNAQIIPKDSILLTTRAPVGYVAIAANDVTTNQGFHSLVPELKIIEPLFLYYLLKNNTEYLKNYASGTTFGELSGGTLKTLKFTIPPLSDQRAIAKILSDLDEKIELNMQMNKTLESIAQTIFKHWFVDFEFPNEQGKPYKSGGGDMVESELGMIPERWQVKSLGEISKIVYGKDSPVRELKKEGFPVYGGNGIIGYSDKYIYEKSQVIVSCRGANSGNIFRTQPFSFVTHNSLIICYDNLGINYMFFTLVNSNIKSTVTGSAQPQITIAELERVSVIIPSSEIINDFENLTGLLFEKQLRILEENDDLAVLRDSLLPKLMMGKL